MKQQPKGNIRFADNIKVTTSSLLKKKKIILHLKNKLNSLLVGIVLFLAKNVHRIMCLEIS